MKLFPSMHRGSSLLFDRLAGIIFNKSKPFRIINAAGPDSSCQMPTKLHVASSFFMSRYCFFIIGGVQTHPGFDQFICVW